MIITFPPLNPTTPDAVVTLAFIKARALDHDGIYNQIVQERGFDPLGAPISESP